MKQSNKAFQAQQELQSKIYELLEIIGEIGEEAEEGKDGEIYFTNENSERIFIKSFKSNNDTPAISIRTQDITLTVSFHDD